MRLEVLPYRIFVTGVPGSKWSSIVNEFEQIQGINQSDQRINREYKSSLENVMPPHRGSYFGEGMEFEARLVPEYLDQAWAQSDECKIVKSHEWSLMLDDIVQTFPGDWIMLIYRPTEVSHQWWCDAGGFNITYPRYSAYRDHRTMRKMIAAQNDKMLKWANAKDLTWHAFSEEWVQQEFGQQISMRPRQLWNDVLVTMYKG